MTNTTHPSRDAGTVPTLDAFIAAAQAAGDDGEVRVHHDGQAYVVLGSGRTATGRDVTWVRSENPDAVSLYLAALSKQYDERIFAAVCRNFDQLAPGTPLSARHVIEAKNMADRTVTAMSGVDFMTDFMNKLREAPLPKDHPPMSTK